jgi:hypothetical protein
MNEQERAVADAFAAGRTEALGAVGTQLVIAEFKVASAGRLDAERLEVLLGAVDLSKFLNPDASVKTEDVATFVDGIAPRSASPGMTAGALTQPPPTAPATPLSPPANPDLGQGAGRGTPPGLNEDDPLLAGLNQPVVRQDGALLFHFPHYQGDTPVSSLREGDLKFVLYYEDNTRLLFDLAKDPSERNNLIESRKEDAARLEAKLRARLSEAGAKLPVASSTYISPVEEPATRKGEAMLS